MDGRIIFVTPTQKDAEKISLIETECFGAAAWSRASVDEFINNQYSHVIAAVCDGELVGYAGAFILCGEAEIANVAVLPSHRRRGIARSMLYELEAVAKSLSAEVLHLEVRESNAAARTLYESLGFVTVGRRKGYYTSPREDAILMTKNLK